MNPAEKVGDFETRPNLTYCTHDSVALAGDLYLPKGAGPFPALVGVHGGGWVQGMRGQFQHWGRYFAARGTALFAISYRFATAKQKTFPHAVQDVLAAIQFVRGSAKDFNIAADRIGVFGHSAGGNLGALAALGGRSPIFANGYPQDKHAKESTEVKVFAGVYGVYDVAQMWQKYNAQSPLQNNIGWFMGAPLPENRQLYFDASPINYATVANNKVAVHLERRHRGRPRRSRSANRRVPAGAQAGGLLRPHHHPARRAALLGQRSDRRARQLLRLPRAAADAIPGGEVVTRGY